MLVIDRRPEMALYPSDLPWLHKPAAVHAVARILVASALNQRRSSRTSTTPPIPASNGHAVLGTAARAGERLARRAARAARAAYLDDAVRRARGHRRAGARVPRHRPQRGADRELRLRRLRLRRGRRRTSSWAHAVDRGWDVVPVIVQDPTWEQSFPQIDGVVVALADARGAAPAAVRLGAPRSRSGVPTTRHGSRPAARLRPLGLDPVLVDDADDRAAVHATLLDWANAALRHGRGTR